MEEGRPLDPPDLCLGGERQYPDPPSIPHGVLPPAICSPAVGRAGDRTTSRNGSVRRAPSTASSPPSRYGLFPPPAFLEMEGVPDALLLPKPHDPICSD